MQIQAAAYSAGLGVSVAMSYPVFSHIDRLPARALMQQSEMADRFLVPVVLPV